MYIHPNAGGLKNDHDKKKKKLLPNGKVPGGA
jgi:hypothetical protein